MEGAVYQLVIVMAGALAIVRGFRRGAARQMPALLALAFTVTVVRVVEPSAVQWLMSEWPSAAAEPGSGYIYGAVAAAMVFFPALMVMWALCNLLDFVLKRIDRGVLSSICGSFITLMIYMTCLSVALNLCAALYPEGNLVEVISHGDGNLAAEVMLISPPILAVPPYDTLLHEQQLDRARYISEYNSINKRVEVAFRLSFVSKV